MQPLLYAEEYSSHRASRISVFEYEKSIDQRIFGIVNRKSKDANAVDGTHEAPNLGVDNDPLVIPA